ncbi:MAG: glutamate racemase [Candidatus Solibacter sp.]
MIGVFDSGVGGLTVLRALRRRMPESDFLYVADTAHAPYGSKPASVVTGYACAVAALLCERGAEGIVVACSTASAMALPELRRRCRVPVWGVIDAGVEAATRATRNGHVGIIGTQATIANGAYQRRLEARGLKVWARACPLLVQVAEEDRASSPEAAMLAQNYLASRPGIDTLILGCTHFPLLRTALQRATGKGVRLVDGAEGVAEEVSAAFEGKLRGTGRVERLTTGPQRKLAALVQQAALA